MPNVGLAAIPPPVDFGLENFQGIPQMDGVNNIRKGYNEFVLYGEKLYYDELELPASYYYLYVGMTWDNGDNGVLTDEGAGRGLFFRNFYTDTIEGFYCTRDETAFFNWDCVGSKINANVWAPEVDEMPDIRTPTSWWVCGVEDKNTYTQAQCRQQMIEDGQEDDDRIRYSDEVNLEFWGLAFTESPASLKWVDGGLLALKQAMTSLSGAALGLACAAGYLAF